LRIDGKKKEDNLRLKDKEKEKKYRKCLITKEREKDNIESSKSNLKELDRNKKGRNKNFSLLFKKWKEIQRDSITISSSLMMLSKDSSKRINLRLLSQEVSVDNLILSFNVRNQNLKPLKECR
jgi:hypothetical protein